MSTEESGAEWDIADAVARIAAAEERSQLLECMADVWRAFASAQVGLVFATDGDGSSWTVVAASPHGTASRPDAGVESATLLSSRAITWIAPDAVKRISAVDGDGLGVRLAPADAHEYVFVALGVTQPRAQLDMEMARAVAAICTMALDHDLGRTRADAERSKAVGLVSAGILLSSELNLDDVLQRLVDIARNVMGAGYAALGVLDEEGGGLSNFVVSGMDAGERRRVGALPRGKGLLGLLIREPHPVRIASIADDPRSAGFPDGHPIMKTFLGVPIRVGAKVFGNLYLTDRLDGALFTEDDELVALTLAAQAAVAIGNAQRYTEQEQTALRASQERERARAEGLRRAIEAQEAERARIARELHDEAGQELTALALQLRVMDDHVTSDAGRAHLAAVRHALARTSTNLRALAIELRPSGLKDHGLRSAIERQARRVQESTGITIDLAVAPVPERLGESVEIALFRVVQEALTNVARHSGGTRASVIASVHAGRLRLVIEDDGNGFDPAAPTDRLGLAGIRERIQLIGGELWIESADREGTTVIVEVEISND